ncbi:amidohydrolase family protein [Streptomyces sp. NBC_01445]|uniref:amidohydrolase family protein n=1 Tax=Streptomyces sp. NBC_01445 TaxID=2903869 RepID=UPI002DDA7561|nr:amidohydrolase family protein [Streptomyces sp. NBC_01445]WSE11267.1 amidohydrolase family protein [Streptomyces sp. NBC_01445]
MMPTIVRTERFSYFGAGERCGELVVTHRHDGSLVTDFTVSNNGRGAKLHEELALDEEQLPWRWLVEGTSLMGGPVHEHFTGDDVSRQWTSQAETGQDAGPAKLYLPADTSPYCAWIAARAALANGGCVDALPHGRIHAELVHRTELHTGGAAVPVEVYFVRGRGLTPEYVIADATGALIAWLGMGADMLVRDDFADQLPALTELESVLTHSHLERVQARIRHRFDGPVRIRRVRIFDPDTLKLTEPMSVTMFRDRITGVELDEKAVSVAGETVIDGDGGTLIAGLHDMHAHVKPIDGLFYLAAGVTTVRDMGNANDVLLALTTNWDTGLTPGPRVVRSGFIEGRSPHSALFGFIPNTLEEALDAVRWYAARGYHQIKLYNSMNPDWVPALTAEAHRLGLRAVGHIPAFTTPDRMIESGYDEVTHVNQLMLGWLLEEGADTRTPLRLTAMARAKDLDLDSEPVWHTLELMRERGIGLDPTAVIVERLMLSRARTVLPADAPFLSHMPIGYQRQRKRTYVPFDSEDDLRAYDESFPMVLKVLKLLHDQGIPLWPGTDDSTGFTVHRELELYAKAGIPTADVLRIATRDCAAHLGLGHSHGSIDTGKNASFLLLDGDPLQDISVVRNIRMVVKDGDVYYPHDIYTELGIVPFNSPPATTSQERTA